MIKQTNKQRLLPILSLFLLISTMIANTQNEFVQIVGPQGAISEPLKKILNLTNIVHNGTLDDVVKHTQKGWLRKPGTERWEMDDLHENLRTALWPLLTQLGTINALYPKYTNYDYCIILGATVPRMRIRLAYAVELWKKGVQFKELIFLVGQRPLDSQIESYAILYNPTDLELPLNETWRPSTIKPKTEFDAAKIIYEQVALPPTFLNTVKVSFIDTPGSTNSEGVYLRPTTGDTVHAWLAHNPKAGSIVAISNQPFINYQHAVLKTFLPCAFTLETVGNSIDSSPQISVMLDNLARWLYQENIYLKNK